MDIQQFATQLKKKDKASPLMKALQDLQARDLDQFRDDLKRLENWYIWPSATQDQEPQIL
jgi:hypothetical protein